MSHTDWAVKLSNQQRTITAMTRRVKKGSRVRYERARNVLSVVAFDGFGIATDSEPPGKGTQAGHRCGKRIRCLASSQSRRVDEFGLEWFG